MDSTDVVYAAGQHEGDILPGPTEQKYTVQLLDTSQPFALAGTTSGSLVRLPQRRRKKWPPAVLFDIVYASAVAQAFGDFHGDILKTWKDVYYGGEVTTPGRRDLQQLHESQADRRAQNKRHATERDTRYEKRSRDDPRRELDNVDILMAIRFQGVPREELARYLAEDREKMARKEREKVEPIVNSWREQVAADGHPLPANDGEMDDSCSDSDGSILDMPITPHQKDVSSGMASETTM